MDQALFDDLQHTLQGAGATAAIDRLCAALRDRKDYAGLFYALLLRKRHQLGAPLVPTGPAQELPAELHAAYEDAIRNAGREVGRLFLDEGNVPAAWAYFRMLGEPEPVRAALEQARPAEGEDCHQLVDIAYHQGVHPRRGFDLILERYGICSAITTLGGQEFPHPPDVRTYCIQKLVRALHQELCERLKAEIVQQEGSAPATQRVPELIAGRDWLFGEDYYHVDVSHLSSVVQMSIHLPKCEELDLARQLCAYGQRLSSRFQYASDPPFENQYRDYGVYLAVLAGDDIEGGLAHFRAKAEAADPETVGTYPAEVLVNLLLRLDRPAEALAVARRFLTGADERRLSCPSLTDLCQRTGDYRTLAEVARAQGNPVHFVAGLIHAANGAGGVEAGAIG
jgi:hypothetical protein